MKVNIVYESVPDGVTVTTYDNAEDVTVEEGFVILTLPGRILSIPAARVFYVEVVRG